MSLLNSKQMILPDTFVQSRIGIIAIILIIEMMLACPGRFMVRIHGRTEKLRDFVCGPLNDFPCIYCSHFDGILISSLALARPQ